jgi:hypothetical protein
MNADSAKRPSRACSGVRSLNHQPEAQYPKTSAIDKLPADYPI